MFNLHQMLVKDTVPKLPWPPLSHPFPPLPMPAPEQGGQRIRKGKKDKNQMVKDNKG